MEDFGKKIYMVAILIVGLVAADGGRIEDPELLSGRGRYLDAKCVHVTACNASGG